MYADPLNGFDPTIFGLNTLEISITYIPSYISPTYKKLSSVETLTAINSLPN